MSEHVLRVEEVSILYVFHCTCTVYRSLHDIDYCEWQITHCNHLIVSLADRNIHTDPVIIERSTGCTGRFLLSVTCSQKMHSLHAFKWYQVLKYNSLLVLDNNNKAIWYLIDVQDVITHGCVRISATKDFIKYIDYCFFLKHQILLLWQIFLFFLY